MAHQARIELSSNSNLAYLANHCIARSTLNRLFKLALFNTESAVGGI